MKTPSKPIKHTKVWQEMVVQSISKSKSTHDLGKKTSQHMIDSKTHQHMRWDINRNQIKQHMRDKTPIENKIPIKTTNIN